MWQPAVTTVAPAREPVDLGTAKAFLNGVPAGDDPIVGLLLAAARGHVEAYTGLRLAEQTVQLRAGDFADLRHLPIAPLREVVEIRYLDPTGAEQLLDPAIYEECGAGVCRGIRCRIGATWPALARGDVDDAVVVTATFGFDQPSLPTPVFHAILLLLGDLYANREDTIAERGVTPSTLPNGVDALLANFRVF